MPASATATEIRAKSSSTEWDPDSCSPPCASCRDGRRNSPKLLLTEPGGQTHPTTHKREQRQNHERHRHTRRRFVQMVFRLVVHALVTPERQADQAKHVEGGQACGRQTHSQTKG